MNGPKPGLTAMREAKDSCVSGFGSWNHLFIPILFITNEAPTLVVWSYWKLSFCIISNIDKDEFARFITWCFSRVRYLNSKADIRGDLFSYWSLRNL